MAGGFVEARVDPVSSLAYVFLLEFDIIKGHSKHEHHLLHAEVKALQKILRISYKNVAH